MAGSLLAALAPTGGWLIAARALQGLGAAVTFPASMAVVTQAFPPERRGRAFGLQTTVAGCFMASGPLVGGFFSEVVSWRWIFVINLPIMAIAGGILLVTLGPVSPPAPKSGASFWSRLDYPGVVTLTAGLSGITIALMQSSDWGWTSPAVVAGFVGGVTLTAVFVAIELRRPEPLIELDLLAIPTFTGGNIAFAAFQFEKMIVFEPSRTVTQHCAATRSRPWSSMRRCSSTTPRMRAETRSRSSDRSSTPNSMDLSLRREASWWNRSTGRCCGCMRMASTKHSNTGGSVLIESVAWRRASTSSPHPSGPAATISLASAQVLPHDRRMIDYVENLCR